MALITYVDALRHLKQHPDGVDRIDVELKMEQATAVVLAYIARSDDEDYTAEIAAWDASTVPAAVQAAILMQFAEFYRFRGDDEQTPRRDFGSLSPQIVAVLSASGYRRPVVA